MKSLGELIIGLAVLFFFVSWLADSWPFILIVATATGGMLAIAGLIVVATVLIRHIRKRIYFSSEAFREQRAAISALISEHNDITGYVQSIRDQGIFELGYSESGKNSKLATSQNTSQHKYRRDRNVPAYASRNVHNCSLHIVRKAHESPIKYMMKYFHIAATEETVEAVEDLGERISRLESAIANLGARENQIKDAMSPPPFILKHFQQEFLDQVGVQLAPVTVPYPVYTFEYVSAGGNSSQRTTIKLDTPTIDAVIVILSEKIRFRKSAAGQRALMTAKLREKIKERDDYTCCHCQVSLSDEPHLLLEVDHVVPVSKGGLSIESNLQTLCWRCNRTKSDKMQQTESRGACYA